MDVSIQKSVLNSGCKIKITGSKSESNRLLLLQSVYPNLQIENCSNSDDSEVMRKALQVNRGVIDVHHAGTAMRFLTAYYATKADTDVVLTGSSRMQERPIKILVDALKNLGADISYVNKEGYPPLKIKGRVITKQDVTLKANVSSQYISALLLVASQLTNGISLNLEGDITSLPYINMTLDLLKSIGVETTFIGNTITIKQKQDKVEIKNCTVESDWSSASYWYSCIALCEVGTKVQLSSYKKESLQGDNALANIYKAFGVETTFENNSIQLQKTQTESQQEILLDLTESPDIAQTIVVTAFGLGLNCNLSGLHTLKIKETDRLQALKNELEKLGAEINITDSSLELKSTDTINADISIATYNDHRMAMAFAPLALKVPIHIKDADVVSKSYPEFWEDLKAVGFILK